MLLRVLHGFMAHGTLYFFMILAIASDVLIEHRTEVEFKTKRAFTRSQRSSTSAEYNKSALTDHALQENHVINWSDASVIDREPDRATRWIKEAIHIRKEGHQAMTSV